MPSKFEIPCQLPKCGAEGLLADLRSSLVVIVTHPWGPLGGNMHNNVVTAVVLYFQRLGLSTFRFNFAGSQIGRGNRQVDQVAEAAEYVLEMTQNARFILLVGYSYGSLIASSASAALSQCVAVVSIAPPFGVQHWLLLFNARAHLGRAKQRLTLPRLMVIGTRDNFTSEDSFHDIVLDFPKKSTTGAVLKGADHFFFKREKDLMDVIGRWILTTFEVNSLSVLKTLDFESILRERSKEEAERIVAEMSSEDDSVYANMGLYDCARTTC